ncbi:methyltransferase [Elioraea rosea]|uniref:methyltransferase n=1 Tax=Elioraea rosea TaxID=2492390 RepID=UPI00118488C3|nr:methyltransferase [Elioraea rosea]
MQQAVLAGGPDLASSGAMMRLITAAWAARIVHTAAELRIADHLVEGPRDAGALAAATAAHAPSLARLLRALAALGVLREDDDRRYALTPLGATLQSDAPGSMRPWVLLCFSDDQGKAWEALTHAVRTGEQAYRHIFGMDKWTHLAQRPEAARLFDAAMQSLTEGANGALIEHYPFDRFRWIVDVGGGNGSLLMPVLARHPDMRATVFDLPHVADAARAHIAEAGLSDRYDAVGGDAFASVPAGADAYVLKGVIHDWEDAEALAILRTVRVAMGEGARLLVIERILPERIDPSDILTPGRFIHDINMMLNPGGRERTEAEFRVLLDSAGFRLARTVPIPCPLSVIEADPV